MDLCGPISNVGYKGYWEASGGSSDLELWEILQVGEARDSQRLSIWSDVAC
jgi:hypothetical protein